MKRSVAVSLLLMGAAAACKPDDPAVADNRPNPECTDRADSDVSCGPSPVLLSQSGSHGGGSNAYLWYMIGRSTASAESAHAAPPVTASRGGFGAGSGVHGGGGAS